MTELNNLAWLESRGFVVGERDPRINTKFHGRYMVAEPYADSELPTEDGSDGPWAIVGDSLEDLIEQAAQCWRVGDHHVLELTNVRSA